MSLMSYLSKLAGKAFIELGLPAELGEVLPSQRPELAQFQINGAMAAAKQAGRPPRDITGDRHLGYRREGEELTVLVDYAGPNVAKAMHVGHLRATIIGDALARLFTFAGHDVIRDPHFGDWGFQMGLLITVVRDEGIDPATITLADLQRIYPEASERAESDEEFADRAREATVRLQQGDEDAIRIWQHMKSVSEESQREDFSALGVDFDLWYGESDVADLLNPLAEKLEAEGVAAISDGALVIRVAEPDDNREWPPLILRSSAGGFLYSTTDLATVQMRVDVLEVDLMLYVVDSRQGDHFTQLFRAAR
jgi:arginyl-tRNA synthetase